MVRFWNNLIEMFLEWPFSELFLKFWSVNKHGISEWRFLALYRHKEILVSSFLKATKKKLARAISKKVNDPGPSWPSCYVSISIDQGQNRFCPVCLSTKSCNISHSFWMMSDRAFIFLVVTPYLVVKVISLGQLSLLSYNVFKSILCDGH